MRQPIADWQLRVLLAEDEIGLRDPLARYLQREHGYEVDPAADLGEARSLLARAERPYDVALIDDLLAPSPGEEPEYVGIALLGEVKDRWPETEVIIFTGWGMDRALEALQAGAYRYLAKPLNLDEVGVTIRMAAERRRLRWQLQTTKQEKEWLQTFLEIGTATTSVLELDEVLECVHEQVGRLMDASCLDVILYDEESQALQFRLGYDRGEREDGWEHPFAQGRGLTDWVIEHRQPLLIKDYLCEEPPVPAYQRGEPTRSWLGVPLVAQGRVIGAITVQSYEPNQFNETHRQILITVASQVANAVENARQFSEASETRERLDALVASSFDAVVFIDQDRKIRVFNRAAEEMCGWTAREMVGQTVTRLHADIEKAREVFDTVKRDGLISGWNVELRHQDGRSIPILLSAVLIRDSQGRPIGQAGFLRDLQRVSLLEERLRALREVTQTVTGTLALGEVLDLIAKSAVAAFPAAKGGTIHLYDEQAGVLRPQANIYQFAPETAEALTFRIGEGIAGWVCEHRVALVVDDAEQDPHYKRVDCSEIPPHKSIICVPLQARGQVIGALSLDNPDVPGAFHVEDLGLLRSFADQAAIAIDNARLFQEAEDGQAYLRSLYQASGSITSLRPPDQVLQDIVERACTSVGAWRVNVVLIDEEGRPQRLARVGFDRLIDVDTSIRPTGVSLEVMRMGEPVLIDDVDAQRERVHPGLIVDGVRAAACFPLRLREKPIGVMWVHYREPHHFSEAEVEALRLYANQAAIAYDNSRRMRELDHLRRAAEKLAGVASVQEVLHQIVKSAREVLGAASAVIWSYDPVRQVFLPDELSADGVEPELLDRFGRDEPRPGGTADVIIQREYVAVTDVDDPEYAYLGSTAHGLRGAIGVKAFQGIALQEGGDTLGVLYVNYDHRRSFTDEDMATLEMFAYHAALTLKKARLLEKVSKARDTAKVVAEVSVLEDLLSTLDSIVHGTQEALRCDAVTLFTYDQPRGAFGSPPTIVGVQDSAKLLQGSWVAQESVLWRIMARDEPYVAEDASSDPIVGGTFVEREGIKSSVSLPLKVRDRKVGVMFVNFRTQHRFTEEELKNIELFAYQAAVAIRNAQLYEETARWAAALQALYQAGQAVNSTLALDEILNRIVEQAWRITGRYGKCACLSDLALKEGSRLISRAAYPPEHLAGLQQKMGDVDLEQDECIGIKGRAVKTGQSQRIGDVAQDPNYIGYSLEVRSELAVPITLGEEVIGTINVEHPDYNAFDRDDQRDLESLAAQAAIAIENARLFEEAEHRALQLAAASEVARDATAILDAGRLLDEAVCLISERFGFYHAAVFLLDEAREYAVLHAASSAGGRRMLELGYKLKVGEVGIVGYVTGTGEPRIALDVGQDTVHLRNPHLPDTRSEMAVPLAVRGQVVGTLDVQSTEVDAFTDGDVATLQIIADHLANAIENARLYEKLQQETRQLALINQIAAEISSTLDLEKILRTLLDELARVVGVEQCAIAIFDEQGDYGDVVSEHLETGCVPSTGSRIPLRDNLSVEWVRRTKKPLAVKDAQHDPRTEKVWNIMERRRTRSIMIVPIVVGDEVIGTIGLDAVCGFREFTREEQWLAETIAHHASIAIQNARRYEELKCTKGLVGARTALAWMGMTSSAWRHAIGNYATTIQDLVELARRDVAAGSTSEKIPERLGRIEDMAKKICSTPITAPLQAEEGVRSVAINELLRERVKQLGGRRPYREVEVDFNLSADESATVRASPDWLRRVFDILADNAVEAMADSAIRKLSIVTRSVRGGVELAMTDTGPGIPDEVAQLLFQAPIPRSKGAKGLGVGLLMAHTIVQTYGGDMWLGATGPSGATMLVWLPVES